MAATSETRVRDPVCGMLVDPAKAAGKFDYQGQTYYFCNPRCLQKFQAQPDVYLMPTPVASGMQLPVMQPGDSPPLRSGLAVVDLAATGSQQSSAFRPPPSASTYICPMDPEVRQDHPGSCPKCGMALEPEHIAPPPTRTQWVCPMHPQIVRDEPGNCPICGMGLEPQTVTAADAPNPELIDMSRRFWISVALSAPLFIIAMIDMLPSMPLQHWLGATTLRWIEFALATPVVLWCGLPFFERGWQSIVNRSPNMFTLIAIGTGAAYGFSVVATLAPGLFPETLLGHGGKVPVYFESAAVIITLVLLGQVLELRARGQTSSAIRACWGWRRKRRGALKPVAASMTCHWIRCKSAIDCAYGPGKRFRLMARRSKAQAASMNR